MKAHELLVEVDLSDLSYYSPEEDELSRFSFSDVRKPKLTLRHLNRLKKIRLTRKAENLKHQELLSVMYGVPEGEEGGL